MEPDEHGTDRVSRRIAEYICHDLGWDGSPEQLVAEDSVSLPEILDSTELLDLAGFLEDEYSITLGDDEVVAKNFATTRVLAGLVVAKQAASSGRG